MSPAPRGVLRRPARGFTLIELLVALAIFAVVAGAVYGGLATAIRGWEAGARRGDAIETARAVQRFVAQRIERTAVIAVRDAGRWRLRFTGAAGRLDLVTEMPPWIGTAGLYDVTLAFERGAGGEDQLVARWAPFGDRFAGTEVSERVLAEGVDEGRFEYFGASDPESAPAWRSSWDVDDRAPSLVRVSVRDAALGAWPELTVALQADSVRYLRTRGAGPAPAGEEPEESSPDELPPGEPADAPADEPAPNLTGEQGG